MPAERYYHPEFLASTQTIVLEGQEHHHLVNVMRTKIDEEIEIVNGMGQLAIARLQSAEKKRAFLVIQSVQTEPDQTKRIILAQGMPRLNRLEFIIEKGTELGMTEIWLFPASRSEKKELSDHQIERLTAMSIAAMKQCGRLFLPKIILLPPLKKWKGVDDIDAAFFGDVAPNAPPLYSVWEQSPFKNSVIFFIGPESGLTQEEEAILGKWKVHGVKLHGNILRTDTAAIVALALLSAGSNS